MGAKVLLETLRHFGKKMSSTKQQLVGEVFQLLSSNQEYMQKMAQQVSSSGGKKSINMVGMIETVTKRCTDEDVVQHGRALLASCDGWSFFRSSSRRDVMKENYAN